MQYPPLVDGSRLRFLGPADTIVAELRISDRPGDVCLFDIRQPISLNLLRYIAAGEWRDEAGRRIAANDKECDPLTPQKECPHCQRGYEAEHHARAWENLEVK